MEKAKNNFISNLIEAELIKFGKFVLKANLEANVYYDIRAIVRYPLLLKELIYIIQKYILPQFIGKFDVICGVPIGAISIAVALGYAANEPVVLLRDTVKTHGLRKRVEGKQVTDTRCILIEDVTTTGSSIASTIQCLREEGLETIAVIVVVDRREDPGTLIENVPVIGVLTHQMIQQFFVKELIPEISN